MYSKLVEDALKTIRPALTFEEFRTTEGSHLKGESLQQGYLKNLEQNKKAREFARKNPLMALVIDRMVTRSLDDLSKKMQELPLTPFKGSSPKWNNER